MVAPQEAFIWAKDPREARVPLKQLQDMLPQSVESIEIIDPTMMVEKIVIQLLNHRDYFAQWQQLIFWECHRTVAVLDQSAEVWARTKQAGVGVVYNTNRGLRVPWRERLP